jgi:toxin ParE1/3/4
VNAVNFTRLARRDLSEILRFIAQDSRRNGERFLARIEAKCQRLADGVELGNPIPKISGVLYWTIRRYVIIFRRMQSGIEVLRVLHGARDWMAEFEEPTE